MMVVSSLFFGLKFQFEKSSIYLFNTGFATRAGDTEIASCCSTCRRIAYDFNFILNYIFGAIETVSRTSLQSVLLSN